MRFVGLLMGVLLLSSCARNAYDFNYDDEKILYGVGNSKSGSNFSNIGIPSFVDNPAAKDPSSFEISPSSGGQAPVAPKGAYKSPYANPYGSSPYGGKTQVNPYSSTKQYKSNRSAPVNSQQQQQPAATQNSPYSGYGQSKNQLFTQPYNQNQNQVQNRNQNSGYGRNVSNVPKPNNNLRKREQAEKYQGLTKTNKTNVIDTNVFSASDRDRFDLLEANSFSPNSNFEKYRPMYKKKGSKKTQEFVDSLQGSLLEEMIENDPISNGFGLENIPSY